MSRTSAAAVPPSRRPFDANHPGGAPRILIIDDDCIAASATQRMLLELGYDARTRASTASEAFELAAGNVPDVVLADTRIQGPVDGIDAAFELRQRHGVGIIFLSDQADDATVARAKRAEPNGYLIKPVSSAALKVAIELALDQQEQQVCARGLERSLAQTAIALLGALNALPLAVQLEDAQDRVFHVNPAFREMFCLGQIAIDPVGMTSAGLMRLLRSRCQDSEDFEGVVDSLRCLQASKTGDMIRLQDGRQVQIDCIALGGGEQCQGRLWTYRIVCGAERDGQEVVRRPASDNQVVLCESLTPLNGLGNRILGED